MTRQQLYILAGLLLVLIAVAVIVTQRNRRAALPSITEENKSARPVDNIGGKVFFPYSASDGSRLLFFGDMGVRLKEFRSNETRNVHEQEILGINKVIWQPQGQWALLRRIEENNELRWYSYEVASGRLVALDASIQAVTFALDGASIVYSFIDQTTGASELSMANPDGSNWRKLRTLPIYPQLLFTLTDQDRLLAYTFLEGAEDSPAELYLLGLNEGDPTKVAEPSAEPVVSRDGKWFAYQEDGSVILIDSTSLSENKVMSLPRDAYLTFEAMGAKLWISDYDAESATPAVYELILSSNKLSKWILTLPGELGRIDDILGAGENTYLLYDHTLYRVDLP